MPTTYTIPNGRTVMNATTYTGDGTNNRAISNADLGTPGFKPDFVWIKDRSRSSEHVLFNSVVGPGYFLESQATDPEYYNSTSLEAFNTNGFTVGSSINWYVNYPVGDGFVAWQWQAGQGTATTNTNGTITSSVSVNQTAGFSVVTFAGTGSNGSVGHGLGAVPSMVFVKDRTNAEEWAVYHSKLTSAAYYLSLNTTNAQTTAAAWNSTTPTSTVFSVGGGSVTNQSGHAYVAYCWAQIAGFSQFGSYPGNGSADGPFIYTGFRPKYLLIKCSTTGSPGYDWFIFDTARDTYNACTKELEANLSLSEDQYSANIDILSNGFKIRNGNGSTNSSGATFIYAAFAENPFKYANAR